MKRLLMMFVAGPGRAARHPHRPKGYASSQGFQTLTWGPTFPGSIRLLVVGRKAGKGRPLQLVAVGIDLGEPGQNIHIGLHFAAGA